MTVVRYAVLPPDQVLNLASPRYLPEIFDAWAGRLPWHHRRYEPVRDLMERVYVDGFNAASGHYERLEQSVVRDGFRNPIVVSAGRLDRRRTAERPPGAPDVVCEYLGGSRLWVAQRLGIDVPCVVNDHIDLLPDAEVLPDADAVRSKFVDPPRTLDLGSDGVYLNDVPYTHLETPYTMAEQAQVRRRVLALVRAAVADWLREHDTWRAAVVAGMGRAGEMHDRRRRPIEVAAGSRLYRGTLNLRLDAPFDWDAPHRTLVVPDAVDYSDLGGAWMAGVARLYPVTVDDTAAWVLRLNRSTAPDDSVEVVAPIHLRSVVGASCRLALR